MSLGFRVERLETVEMSGGAINDGAVLADCADGADDAGAGVVVGVVGVVDVAVGLSLEKNPLSRESIPVEGYGKVVKVCFLSVDEA